jgi:hypothetical protein
VAIRDKVIVRFKNGGKPYAVEVRRPGGKVGFVWTDGGVVKVQEATRKDRVIREAAFNADDVKSVEFEPGT